MGYHMIHSFKHLFAIPFIIVSILVLTACTSSKESPTPYSGISILLFAGGGENSAFSARAIKGAKAAADEMGFDLDVVYSNWHNNTMIRQFKEAIDEDYDGIAMMGHPGEEALSNLIDEAFRKGIVVTSLNVDLPGIRKKYQDEGFGYFGANQFNAGNRLVESTYNKFSLEDGTKVLVFGTKNIPKRGERTLGALAALEAHNAEVIYFDHPGKMDVEEREKLQLAGLRKMLDEHPDAKFIFDDISVKVTVKGLKQFDIPPEATIVSGFDLSPAILTDLKAGYIDVLADQQPYLQGYLSVQQIALSIKWNFGGLLVDTGQGIVTAETVDTIESLIENEVR